MKRKLSEIIYYGLLLSIYSGLSINSIHADDPKIIADSIKKLNTQIQTPEYTERLLKVLSGKIDASDAEIRTTLLYSISNETVLKSNELASFFMSAVKSKDPLLQITILSCIVKHPDLITQQFSVVQFLIKTLSDKSISSTKAYWATKALITFINSGKEETWPNGVNIMLDKAFMNPVVDVDMLLHGIPQNRISKTIKQLKEGNFLSKFRINQIDTFLGKRG